VAATDSTGAGALVAIELSDALPDEADALLYWSVKSCSTGAFVSSSVVAFGLHEAVALNPWASIAAGAASFALAGAVSLWASAAGDNEKVLLTVLFSIGADVVTFPELVAFWAPASPKRGRVKATNNRRSQTRPTLKRSITPPLIMTDLIFLFPSLSTVFISG
jgi:hypothetical protein